MNKWLSNNQPINVTHKVKCSSHCLIAPPLIYTWLTGYYPTVTRYTQCPCQEGIRYKAQGNSCQLVHSHLWLTWMNLQSCFSLLSKSLNYQEWGFICPDVSDVASANTPHEFGKLTTKYLVLNRTFMHFCLHGLLGNSPPFWNLKWHNQYLMEIYGHSRAKATRHEVHFVWEDTAVRQCFVFSYGVWF